MLIVVIGGLAVGSLYALVALVFNVMYSTSKVLSVTAGHTCMLGCVFGAWFIGRLGFSAWIGLAGAVAVGGIFGALTEWICVRRVLQRSDEHLWLLSTLAFGIILQQGMGLWWGTEPRPFPRLLPQDFAGPLDQRYWLPILLLPLAVGALEVFYRGTLHGKAFRAVAEDPFAARARGISTDAARVVSYVLAGGLGAVAGFAAGQLTFAFATLGLTLTLNGFIALAVGGLGSNGGALVGGLALGLLGTLTTYWFGGAFQQTISVGLLMAVLLVRPQGLLPSRQARAV